MGPPQTKQVQFMSEASKLLPVTLGKHRIGIIREVKQVDATPIG